MNCTVQFNAVLSGAATSVRAGGTPLGLVIALA